MDRVDRVARVDRAVPAAAREVQAADTGTDMGVLGADTAVMGKVVPVVGVSMAAVVDTGVGIEDVDDAPTLTGSPSPDK